jgi:hypothetical protein
MNSSPPCSANGDSILDGLTADIRSEVLACDFDPYLKRSLADRFLERCNFARRPFLLWDGCVRQSQSYTWPDGFKDRFSQCGYRGLVKAKRNGPPRTAFTVAGGEYQGGWELDHIYDQEIRSRYRLPHGRHFTQSAGLVCMTRDLHLWRDNNDLWRLRGLAYLLFGYDPLGAFSAEQPDDYGFVKSVKCEVFWP